MLKRLGVTGALVAIGALAVGSVAPATSLGSTSLGTTSTVQVLSDNTEERYVDVGRPGFSLGDMFVFTSKLTHQGVRVGHTGVVCTITSRRRGESQCAGTAWIRGDQIAIQGLVAGDPDVFEFPITGGTGAYEGAQGTLVVKEMPGPKEFLTFHLTR